MNRLARIISELSPEELKLIQKDLETGNIERLIRSRLEQLEKRKTCPTCGKELTSAEQKFAIEFGPADLRQKAYFDEYDCLDYFLQQLHTRKQTP